MKKMFSGVAAAAIVLIVTVSAATAQELTVESNNWTVQSTGRAEMKVTPDEIYVAITLKDNDIKGLSLSQIETRVIKELKELGINPDKDLRVNNMMNAPRKRNQVDTSRSYELKVPDAATLQSVFYALGEMGIKNAKVTRMTHSRIEEYRMQVRIQAMKNAQENARALAGAVGQSISKTVQIQDTGNFYESAPIASYTRNSKLLMEDMEIYASGVAESSLDFQDITLTYSVTAKFILNSK